MDKETEKHILNILRQGTLTWKGRRDCLLKARKRFLVGKYKNGKDEYLWKYLCASCKEWFRDFEVEVDHIDPVGEFKGNIDEYARRMYCSVDNLQCLCVGCHNLKTKGFVAAEKFKRKF